MAIAGKLGAVYRDSGVASIAFTGEATVSNSTYTRYKIADKTKRYFDDKAVISVKVNGTATTNYKVEYAGGVIVFSTALTSSDVVTVSGKYLTMVQCATFYDWKIDISREVKEVTTFASNGWKEYLPTVSGFTGSIQGYWVDGTFKGALGTRMLVVFYTDSVNDVRYEGYLILSKDSVELKVEDVTKENIDLQGTGQIFYHTN